MTRKLTPEEEKLARDLFASNGLDGATTTLARCREIVADVADEHQAFVAHGGNPRYLVELIRAEELGEIDRDEAHQLSMEHLNERRRVWSKRKLGGDA